MGDGALDDDEMADAAEIAEQLENAAAEVVNFMGGGIDGIPFTLAFIHKLIDACVEQAVPVATTDELARLEKVKLAMGHLSSSMLTVIRHIRERQQN